MTIPPRDGPEEPATASRASSVSTVSVGEDSAASPAGLRLDPQSEAAARASSVGSCDEYSAAGFEWNEAAREARSIVLMDRFQELDLVREAMTVRR